MIFNNYSEILICQKIRKNSIMSNSSKLKEFTKEKKLKCDSHQIIHL
jgi:hypothetical protein